MRRPNPEKLVRTNLTFPESVYNRARANQQRLGMQSYAEVVRYGLSILDTLLNSDTEEEFIVRNKKTGEEKRVVIPK